MLPALFLEDYIINIAGFEFFDRDATVALPGVHPKTLDLAEVIQRTMSD